jgi:hypothetical protein
MKRRGGYNRRNFLLRVKDVNEVYLEYHNHGVPAEYIFRNYINERFRIGRTTFFEYLTIPYKRELELLDRKQNKQISLFDESEIQNNQYSNT